MMLEPISSYAGFDWKMNIALIAGVAAKEIVVSTLGTAYSLSADQNGSSLDQVLVKDSHWNIKVALAFLASEHLDR